MKEKFDALMKVYDKATNLRGASALLGWDQQANMPPGGAKARGKQMSTISQIIHELATSDEVGKLLEELKPWAETLNPDSFEARAVKQAVRNYDHSTKMPSEMVAEWGDIRGRAYPAWVEARKNNDFASYVGPLEEVIDFKRRAAALFAPFDHVYDPLLDDYEPGLKTADVMEIFNAIRPQQVELIRAISQAEPVNDSFLHQHFDRDAQKAFGRDVVTSLGYDWSKGFEGEVPHPFCTTIGLGDVRINTRLKEDFFNPYLFGAMHETGHALYGQGQSAEYYGTPLFGSPSSGLNEAQSRTYENLVGRSLAFWKQFYPRLQEYFPAQLGNISMTDFYKAINKVQPSLIRVEADEATYNLHIMLRMEIEIGILERTYEAADLSQIWNAKMEEYLGITPQTDSDGILQDVHWSYGLFGYFPSYALGNLLSVQLWEQMSQDVPGVNDLINDENLPAMRDWYGSNINSHGLKYEPLELIQRVTGGGIDGQPYVNYLTQKFSAIYNL
ncbi:MAG: carboxypeptidase M32 [Anaerolineaceae bacterium]|nr:carboxypeptidase M32 [Anaerolineaceae bacterium]